MQLIREALHEKYGPRPIKYTVEEDAGTLAWKEYDLLVSVADNSNWEDRDDDLTMPIKALHPFYTKDYHTYHKALELVGNRYSKYALVDLVNYLLKKADKDG